MPCYSIAVGVRESNSEGGAACPWTAPPASRGASGGETDHKAKRSFFTSPGGGNIVDTVPDAIYTFSGAMARFGSVQRKAWLGSFCELREKAPPRTPVQGHARRLTSQYQRDSLCTSPTRRPIKLIASGGSFPPYQGG